MTDTPEFYAILTEDGERLKFECEHSNKKFIMSEIAVGDSNGSYYEPVKTQKDLKNPCYRQAITRSITDSKNLVKSVILDIPEKVNGFTVREVGVYGEDGKLLIIGKYPETEKRVPESGALSQLAIKINLTEINELVLPVLIDPSINTASVEYVEKYFQKLEEKGQPEGYASLDENGLVPKQQLPISDFVKGCVNSGPVDENGEPAILSYDKATLTISLVAPFIYTTYSGKTFESKTDLNNVLDENPQGTIRIWVNRNTIGEFYLETNTNNIYTQKAEPLTPQENDIWRNISVAPEIVYKWVNNEWTIYDGVEIGTFSINSEGEFNLITNSYNKSDILTIRDKSEIASWSFPYGEGTPLTLLASGKSYTPKTDGYFYLSKKAGKTNAYVSMYALGLGLSAPSPSAQGNCVLYIKCFKDYPCTIIYDAEGTVNDFRFFPLKGAIDEQN